MIVGIVGLCFEQLGLHLSFFCLEACGLGLVLEILVLLMSLPVNFIEIVSWLSE